LTPARPPRPALAGVVELDDAADEVAGVYKQQREEIRNMQHAKKAEIAAKHKAGKKKVLDVVLTVERTSEEQPELVGASFMVCPRQRPGGMAKIGRSSGDDFKGAKGVSLPKDWGVSTWHGKVRVGCCGTRAMVEPGADERSGRPGKRRQARRLRPLLYAALRVRPSPGS
jgi:hypothetical protein